MRWWLLGFSLLFCSALAAQDSLSYKPIGQDSVYSTERNDRLYDTIAARSGRNALSRLLYRTLVRRPATPNDGVHNVTDAAAPFRPYQGRTIARVEIVPLGLLAGSDSTRIERLAAAFHTTSQRTIIRRDLLFDEGQPLDADLLVKSQQRLETRPYLTEVRMVVEPAPDLPEGVVVRVFTQDNWSIGAGGKLNGNGRTSLELYDANILGYGARLGVAEHFNWKGWSHGGLQVDLQLPNIFGSRFEVALTAGKKFDDSNLGIHIHKEFLTTTDYAMGFDLHDMAQETYLLYADTSTQILSARLDLWAGGSLYLPRIRSSLYLIGRHARHNFGKRPLDTDYDFNPAFHDRSLTLGALGIYRERFYTSNLIYGYGHREFLATGYRIELVGGYSDGEFENQWYGALSYRLGKFLGWGYLTGSAELGGFFSNKPGRGALKVSSHFFSNMWTVGSHLRMRQFVTLTLLHGWNRYGGSQEVVAFRDEYKLRNFHEWMTGSHRATLSLENVLFTSWQPLGFRMALFGFADMGTLGDRNNLLANPFYATVGLGVRFKNERLIFNALELRFGMAVSGRGLLPAQYVALTAQQQVAPMQFRPQAPSIISYR